MALLTDQLKSWIGRERHYIAREELGHASIRYFALALRHENPLHLDDAYAQAAGYPSLIAQPTLVVETSQYAHDAPDDNGYFAHEWHLPAPGCRVVRSGNDYEFVRPILPSDRISVTWLLESMVERSSRRGGTQIFVTSVATFHDAAGQVVAINRETQVLQPVEPNIC
jgi:acyl dehydratase